MSGPEIRAGDGSVVRPADTDQLAMVRRPDETTAEQMWDDLGRWVRRESLA